MPESPAPIVRVRELFDEQVRRGTARDGTGSQVTATSEVVRWCADGDFGWSEIAWSNLDESNANGAIAQQVEYFASKGQGFAWRVLATDSPPDLGVRLERAGFVLGGTSTLMIASIAQMPLDVMLPPGVTLSSEGGVAAIDRLIEVHEKVFEIDHSQLRRSLIKQFESSPALGELVIAMANGVPVASSRVDFLPDREFAGLWGGSTLPEWRGKGLFRAMVAHRAREAAKRGYAYVYVIASSKSEPILTRLSFESYGSVRTYMWRPPRAST
jgi:GNAT superfamily N-acetyltransferase